MLNVYCAEKSPTKNKGSILRHLATSPVAATHRIDSMFASQQLCSTTADFMVNVHDHAAVVIRTKTLDQHLAEFSVHAGQFQITLYSLQALRPLRLTDLWEDDPIGSAGPNVVSPDQLSRSDFAEIRSLFKPFDQVIHVPHIFQVYSVAEIKALKRRYASNRQFMSELQKRKLRSHAINEDFTQAQYQEIVWLDLTFRLKTWAIGKGYDSFVYSNSKEGHGEDTYVNLLPQQLKNTNTSYRFIGDKYRAEMPRIPREMLNNLKRSRVVIRGDGYWAQRDPMVYWELAPDLSAACNPSSRLNC